MSYITNLDIELRVGPAAYVQLADDDKDGLADVAVVDELRLAAEGEVNSYLARRYRTPIDLDEHPELAGLLASITLDLAEFRLRLRRPPVAENIRQRHATTIEWLERIAAGVIELPSLAPVATNFATGPAAMVVGESRLLSREEMSQN